MELDTKHEAATNLTEAGQVLKRDDPKGKGVNINTSNV